MTTRAAAAKKLRNTCSCGREFTTHSGVLHHGRVCPVERARSAAYVAALEAGEDPWAAGAAAVQAARA